MIVEIMHRFGSRFQSILPQLLNMFFIICSILDASRSLKNEKRENTHMAEERRCGGQERKARFDTFE